MAHGIIISGQFGDICLREKNNDPIELGELLCRDALTREESCGGHFREEYQHADGECKRDDDHYAHVAAWEYQGEGRTPLRNTEPLNYEFTKMSVRSYK